MPDGRKNCMSASILEEAHERLREVRLSEKQIGVRSQCGPFDPWPHDFWSVLKAFGPYSDGFGGLEASLWLVFGWKSDLNQMKSGEDELSGFRLQLGAAPNEVGEALEPTFGFLQLL